MPEPGSLQIKEVLPKVGMIHRSTYHERHLEAGGADKQKEDGRAALAIDMVLCKPKLLPMKSVTLEKLERMQKEAQETVKEQEKQAEMENLGGYTSNPGGMSGMGGGIGSVADNPYDFS